MNNQSLKYLPHRTDTEFNSTTLHNQKNRQTYITNTNNIKRQTQNDQNLSATSPAHFHKPQANKNQEVLPPRATPFRRSNNESVDKKDRDRSGYHSSQKQEQGPKDVIRFSALRKKLQQEMRQRQRLQQITACQLQKIENLTIQINKLREQKKQLEHFILQIQKTNEENVLNLKKSQQNIEQLTQNLKEANISKKSLHNLKNLQSQLDSVQEYNKKLMAENQNLLKENQSYKIQLDKLQKENTQDSENNLKGEAEVKRLLGELQKSKSERQKFLQGNLHVLQKKLYQTQNQMKKLLIQMNCSDRKKTLSINQVKASKDQQIKDLRQKFIKVSKDLRQTKDKIQKKDKKVAPKVTPVVKRYKSSKNLGFNSESQELTFELSSDA